jgi:hypothetical protein
MFTLLAAGALRRNASTIGLGTGERCAEVEQ